jgi:peptidoglycan hydrolase-like protein with peptidoglycan-binding domain
MNRSFKNSVVAGMLALTIVAGGAPAASAQSPSISDLQAQINQLLATLNTLKAGQSAGTCTGNWSRSLGQGSTGTDVLRLQQFLNRSADTRVAVSGAGSVGMETSFYGPATAAAVSKFQVKYRGEVLAPNGLLNPTGFFGPSSITKANALCVSTPTQPTTPTTPTTPDSGGDEGVTLQGEGTLEVLEIDDAEKTDIEEAAGDAIIAELTLEAKDGDIEINRLDLSLVADSDATEKDPWDTFENISLWVNDEKISEVRIDNRNDFLNRNLGTVRFSNLDLVLEEDEEITVSIAVSVRNNIKGAGTNASWNVSAQRLRYFDADGAASDESSFGDLGEAVAFDIVVRGDGEELKFALGPNNPDDRNLIVDESRRTNNQTILQYTIEAIDNDIELDTLYVNVETGTAIFSDVVSDIRLVIGNKSFRKEAIVSTGDYTANSVRVAFDIDGDIEIDEDDKETIRVVVDLKPQSNYANGETIRARVTAAERDLTEAEGADDIKEFSGTVVGDEYRLISEGIVTSPDNVSFGFTTQGRDDTTGIFTIEFEVTAVEGDFYINNAATTTSATTSGGVRFSLDTTSGTPTSISAILDSSADERNDGVFIVREGETETFTLQVTVDASAAGQHRVSLEAIHYSTATDGVSDVETYLTTPANEYRTPYGFINE